MPIQLNSNRSFIVKLIIAFIVLWTLFGVAISITILVEYDEELIPWLILSCVFDVVFIIAAVAVKFYKGRRYEFTENEIACYKRNQLLNTIKIADIEKIEFYPYKWRYIATIFFGELPSGGCWSLHVWMKDGKKTVLRFFSKKDAAMLKEKIFGDLLLII
ncbi:MAG: hypothetical protein J1G04_05355 [Clostridiales bacterium]|nr:hypothetical protein [Clostridiales bacterium]